VIPLATPVQASGKMECVEAYRRIKVHVGKTSEKAPAMVARVKGRRRRWARLGAIARVRSDDFVTGCMADEIIGKSRCCAVDLPRTRYANAG
jgi:hypothetical protein